MKPTVRKCRHCENNARDYGKDCNSCAQIKSRYGLSHSDVVTMQIAQDNRCKICMLQTKLVIDCDHKTRTVHGLLCARCKTIVSLLSRDSTRKQLDYIIVTRNKVCQIEKTQ